LIAKDPTLLDDIEWRELEKLLAEVLAGVGYSVTLTPATKDGGKDLILECRPLVGKRTYFVEIKHWRSEQKVGAKTIKDFTTSWFGKESMAGCFFPPTALPRMCLRSSQKSSGGWSESAPRQRSSLSVDPMCTRQAALFFPQLNCLTTCLPTRSMPRNNKALDADVARCFVLRGVFTLVTSFVCSKSLPFARHAGQLKR
jgi:hypothetical protein